MANPATILTPQAAGSGAAMPIPADQSMLQTLMPFFTSANTGKTTSGGSGDVAGLRQLLATLMPTTQAGGMDPVIQAIFKKGFQDQMPGIYNASNTAGLRPSSTTQQQLMVNDLIARLSSEGAKAVNQQQQTAGNVASAIATNTKAPVVETVKQTQGANTANILPALLLAGGLKIAQGAMNGGAGGTSNVSSSTGDVASIFGTTKKKASDTSVTGDIINQSLGLPSIGTMGNVGINTPPISTGGINPTSSMSQDVYTPQINLGASGGNNNAAGAIGSNLVSMGLEQALPMMGAEMAVPYVGPALAVANLLGINEVTQPVQAIGSAVSDAASGIWNSITSGCYITTAICELEGKADNCHELEMLRRFRDEWLIKQPAGKEMVESYYAQAPKFLAATERAGFRRAMLQHFSSSYIKPSVAAIERGDNETAFKLYVSMLEAANEYVRN